MYIYMFNVLHLIQARINLIDQLTHVSVEKCSMRCRTKIYCTSNISVSETIFSYICYTNFIILIYTYVYVHFSAIIAIFT